MQQQQQQQQSHAEQQATELTRHSSEDNRAESGERQSPGNNKTNDENDFNETNFSNAPLMKIKTERNQSDDDDDSQAHVRATRSFDRETIDEAQPMAPNTQTKDAAGKRRLLLAGVIKS